MNQFVDTERESTPPLLDKDIIAEAHNTEDVKPNLAVLSWVAVLLALVGLFAAGVLSLGHLLNLPVPCGESRGCMTVALHPSSKFFGVPIAYFGFAAYLALIPLLWLAPTVQRARLAAVAITTLGTIISGVLVFYSITIIHATCAWCMASAAAMGLLWVLSITLHRTRKAVRAVSGSNVLSLFFLILAALALQARSMQHAALQPPITAAQLAAVPAHELANTANTLGPNAAPVKIVIFTDFWCPACRKVLPSLLDYQKSNSKSVQLVFRHLPLMQIKGHEFSGTAAALSELAAERGQFWTFVEHLHNQRQQLGSNGYLTLMSKMGFKSDAVKARMDNPNNPAALRVQRDMALAERIGVNATPTFIVLVQGQPPLSANERLLPRILNSPQVQLQLLRNK